MIKIDIPDRQGFKINYVTAVKQLVVSELECLRIAIDQTNGNNIVVDPDFRSFKDVTRKIINTIRSQELPASDFRKVTYIQTVTNFRNGATIAPANLNGLFDLATDLLGNNGAELESLLVCLPEQLKTKNDTLLANHNLTNARESAIIKLAFDYGSQAAIANAIKSCFRTANLVRYCPYCNQEKSMYTPGANGRIADVHQLDHFFDKASYPLLSYSMYNLVPGDATCNSINKHTIPFCDIYNLNPYIAGFDNNMAFSAEIDNTDLSLRSIKLNILTALKAKKLQLIGDGNDVDLDPLHGNINVFQLNSKYNRADVIEIANHIVETIRIAAINRRAIEDILVEAGVAGSYENYKKWYQRTMRTRFDEKEFHLFPYSKLFRDLHDEVYRRNTRAHNQEVIDIIDQRYQ